MFSKDSILYEVNAISKILGFIFLSIGLVLLQIPGMIVLITIILLYLSYPFRYTFRFSAISLGISVLGSFYPPILWISKIFILINYLILVKKVTTNTDLRYILEVTLYKFQSKRITYHILYLIYFSQYMKKNMKILNKLRDEYMIKRDWFYFQFSLKKSYVKTKYEMKELMIINRFRFYNDTSKRTYIEKPSWERWDNAYLLFHLLFFVFVVVYGG